MVSIFTIFTLLFETVFHLFVIKGKHTDIRLPVRPFGSKRQASFPELRSSIFEQALASAEG